MNTEVTINRLNPVVTIRAALVCTTADNDYSIGFRNGLRFAIAVLTGKEQQFEEEPQINKII